MNTHTSPRNEANIQFCFFNQLILTYFFVPDTSRDVNKFDDFFQKFEKNLCTTIYPNYTCKRLVVLYGDDEFSDAMTPKQKDKVIFRLKTDGTMITYNKCPQSIKDVISNLEK